MTFQAYYAITCPSASVPAQFQLDVICGQGGECDYSHTGAIGLQLPEGVTYTSNSGVFLTEPENAPEPGTALLLVFGLGAVSAVAAWNTRGRKQAISVPTRNTIPVRISRRERTNPVK